MYQKYLAGKKSIGEIATDYQVSLSTVNRWFAPFRQDIYQVKSLECQDEIVIIEREATLIAAINPHQVVFWGFYPRENATYWKDFFSKLNGRPRVTVGDGQKGMIKAVHTYLPSVAFQRCQFHVQSYIKKKLGAQPRHQASRDLKALSKQITKVESFCDLANWLIYWDFWCQEYEDFLQEKTYWYDHNHRRHWRYKHRKLHAAYSHLKNAIPDLFTYLWIPNTPNTTNIIEGGINSPIRNQLFFHRGATIQTQRQIISVFLRSRRR